MEGIVDKGSNLSGCTVAKSASVERRWRRSVKRRYNDKSSDATRYASSECSDDKHVDKLDNDTRYNDTIYIDARCDDASLCEQESPNGNLSFETRRSACGSDSYDGKTYHGIEKMHFDDIGTEVNHRKVHQNSVDAVDSSVIAKEAMLFDSKRSTGNGNGRGNVCENLESVPLSGFEVNLKLDKQGGNGYKTASSDSRALIMFQGPRFAEVSQSSFQRSTSYNTRGKVANDLERIPFDGVGNIFKFQKPEGKAREIDGFSDFHSSLEDLGERVESGSSRAFAQKSNPNKFEAFPIQVMGMNAQSRKRASSLASCEEEEDSVSYKEVMMLKKALKSERDAIQKLHKELEEERCASKTAADEAISMISRLQEEKAALLMESSHYRRFVEEREWHRQEAIDTLKEALLDKEYELLSLQERMEAYQEMFMSIESHQRKDNTLEQGSGKEKFLLLESLDTSPSMSYEDGKHLNFRYGSQIMDNNMSNEADLHVPETEMLDLRSSYWAARDSRTSNTGRHLKDFNPGNVEIGGHSLSAEDMSMAILDRVKRLEERLEHIRHNQVLHHENANHGVVPHDVDQEEARDHEDYSISKPSYANKGWVNPLQIDPKGKYSLHDKSLNPSFARGLDKGFEIVSPTRDTKSVGIQNQEECSMVYDTDVDSGMKEVKSRVWETGTSKSIDGDDSGESIHDVYEVHEMKESTVHANDLYCQKIEEKHSSGVGNASLYSTQESISGDGVILQPHGSFGAEASKLSVEFSALNIHRSMGDEDVDELKVRLQALESERVFMKEAIESLRKENGELKLLQEIAQQLRELKGDVRRVEGSAMQFPLPFVSFLKSLMSFAGIQSLSTVEEKRRKATIVPTTQDGLLQILNKCSGDPRIGYMTREYKIKITI